MPADYKHRKARAPQPKRSPGWVWFVIGALVGLFAAFLFYLKGGDLLPPRPAPTPQARAVAPAETPAPRLRQPAKPRPKALPKPRFEFYTMLPEMEISVSDIEVAPARPAREEARDDGEFLLQVASFRQLPEADRLKAQLALLGMEAHIQSVAIDGKDTWHRVRTGPYSTLRDLEKTRNRLREEGLRPIALKVTR